MRRSGAGFEHFALVEARRNRVVLAHEPIEIDEHSQPGVDRAARAPGLDAVVMPDIVEVRREAILVDVEPRRAAWQRLAWSVTGRLRVQPRGELGLGWRRDAPRKWIVRRQVVHH